MPTFEPDEINASLARALGGSPARFYADYWRQTPLYVPQAAPEFAGVYGVEEFLEDMVATQPTPYVSVGVRDGSRNFTRHETAEQLRNAVLAGGVATIKLSKIWHNPQAPRRWGWMRALFGALCRATAMMYLSPSRSEDVDLFLAGPQSQLGCHFDTTEAFTIQVSGERRWTMEETADPDRTLRAARDRDWRPAKELKFDSPTREVVLAPGDSLYVPAYSLHRVTGVTWSVSLGLGVRAFNEIDFVEHLLESIRTTRYADYTPVPSAPEMLPDEHAAAKLELLRRVRALLTEVEMAAIGSILAPLEVPPTLDMPPAGAPATLAAGFTPFHEPTD